ncbi:phage tail assembly chaperone [Lysobacter sp. HA35]
MTKLSLNPPSAFKSRVEIPVAGSRAVAVDFTFKYRDREALRQFVGEMHGDAEAVLHAVEGWELDDDFNEANVRKLCNSYPGAAFAIVNEYLRQLQGR